MTDTNQRQLEIANAKAELCKSQDGQPSVYELLTKSIRKILDEKPADAAKKLSNVIGQVEMETIKPVPNFARHQEVKENSPDYKIADKQRSLFEQTAGMDSFEEEEEVLGTAVPDIPQLSNNFEQCCVGLGRSEWTKVYFAIMKLCNDQPITSCRFFGKIMGLEKNYYIVEASLSDYDVEHEEEKMLMDSLRPDNVSEADSDDEDPLPKSTFQLPPIIPLENTGKPGVNKYVYYVCNIPGQKWKKLPSCTPEQIKASRFVTKYFTGNLTAPVESFPAFPGSEENYLRCQIARITASTMIAPATFYQFDEDEEVEEEEFAQTDFVQNPDFEGVPLRELADPTLQAWVHCRLPILKQGRCIWWNTKESQDNDDEFDEEEAEDGDDAGENEQEIGPPLLTQVSDDEDIAGIQPWTTQLASGLANIFHTLCIVKSNLWPGASIYSDGKKFDHIYIGWGQKYEVTNHSPAMLDLFESECTKPLVEVSDPTVEEENALKAQAVEDEDFDEPEDEEDDQ